MSYDEYLDSLQTTTSDFRPIRWYATNLKRQFNDIKDYEEALSIARKWYATKGHDAYASSKPVKSEIYSELRKDGKDFLGVLYLVKPLGSELNEDDKTLIMNIVDKYGTLTSLPWTKYADKNDKSIWKTTFKFNKGSFSMSIVSRFKHDIVNDIRRSDFNDKYDANSRIPLWIYESNDVDRFKDKLVNIINYVKESIDDNIIFNSMPDDTLSTDEPISEYELEDDEIPFDQYELIDDIDDEHEEIENVPETPAPRFRVYWKAWKDGNDAQGESESNLETSQMAKAEAMTKLTDLGFTNIEILAIESNEENQ